MAEPRPRILHLFPAFDPAPHVIRQVQLMNALAGKAEHAIVSGDLGRRGAARNLTPKVRISWPRFPSLAGSKMPGRLLKLASAMAGYDLICTYGAGALDAAFAHTLFADVHKLPPLVHHEHGAGEGEIGGRRRAWYRRFALGRTAALVVPDAVLERIAIERWDQPRGRVRLIAPGISTRAFSAPARRDALPGLIKRKDELWLGVLAQSMGADPPALVRVLAELPVEWQLLVAGETTEQATLEQAAETLGVEDRLHFAGSTANTTMPTLLTLFDLLVLLDPEAVPERIIEAMAAGLAVIAPRGGQAVNALSSENGALLAEPGDLAAIADKLSEIATRPTDRKRIGQANRAKARAEFDQQREHDQMWALYRNLMVPSLAPVD